MRHVSFAFVTTLLAYVLGAEVDARSCSPPGPVDREFELATKVFVGKVIATEARQAADVTLAQTVATFEVEEAWKGAPGPSVQVATCGAESVGIICTVAVDFVVDERMLVFAFGEPPATSKCGRTGGNDSPFWSATLEWLRAKPSRKAG